MTSAFKSIVLLLIWVIAVFLINPPVFSDGPESDSAFDLVIVWGCQAIVFAGIGWQLFKLLGFLRQGFEAKAVYRTRPSRPLRRFGEDEEV